MIISIGKWGGIYAAKGRVVIGWLAVSFILGGFRILSRDKHVEIQNEYYKKHR